MSLFFRRGGVVQGSGFRVLRLGSRVVASHLL